LTKFENLEPKRFDLRENPIHCRRILKPAREHGLAAPHLRPHGRKRGQRGRSEPAPYPDRVLAAGLCGHIMMVGHDPVSGRHRNLMICPWADGNSRRRRCGGPDGKESPTDPCSLAQTTQVQATSFPLRGGAETAVALSQRCAIQRGQEGITKKPTNGTQDAP
jgi:hypothetical protein